MKKSATIICGPQGSGKSIKARKLAGAIGRFIEVEGSEFLGRFGLAACACAPAAVIIEEVVPSEAARIIQKLKGLITSSAILVDRKYQKPLAIPTPHFFLVTSRSVDFLHEDDRRYTVIECKRGA